MGFVDWNPIAPDRNMGIFREVFIEENNGIGVSDPFITSSLNDDLTAATLQASVVVTNFTGKTQSGAVNLSIGSKNISKKIVLAAGESHKVIFTASGFPQLKINSPKLWWPHTIGTPNMYQAAFSFQEGNTIFDRKKVDFGIRTVSSYLTPDGHRAYRINGKKIQIHGAGWTDRMLLDDTPESVKEQLTYVKDINLNTIRLEGFWGNSQAIYNLCDQMGILVMVGWSCQWEWPKRLGKATDNKYGGILNDEDMSMMSEAWKDQIVWLRNHPSIFTWFAGSDLEPKPELERKYFEILKTYDSTRVYLASAKKTTTLAGPTGVKMEGPYAYIPPVYWFSDSIKGGAYGFATEIGPGAQVPPAESIKKMLSEKHWWPKDEMWNYHSGRGKFGTLDRFTKALEKRYGKITDFDDFEKKAQLLNYELMRPMFEAYSARRYKATGLILWMLNSAWPEMYWQLYDYYLMPSAAYYGAKTAQRPYHVIYDYYRKSLVVVNDKLTDKNNCKLKLRVYDTNSVLKFQKDIDVDLKANSPKEILVLPKLNIPSMYFIDTRLYDETGNEIDNNFYWVSQKEDILDYNDTSEAWYVTTVSKQYADFTALNKMQKLKVESKMLVKKVNEKTTFEVTLKNTSDKIAFFIHSAIIDSKTGKTILPVIWSDNYVSLLPGEERVLMAGINNTKLKGTEIKLVVDGYNLK
jgi:exo-1,4-beta-D-glucosaminidase